jgi:RecB family exonuclease
MSFPEETAMIGTLAHQVLEDAFTSGSIPEPSSAATTAARQFAVRVPEIASALLLPENRTEYEDILKRVSDAAADVARRFTEAGFIRLECEEWIKTSLDGIPVHGRADVVAFDVDDNPHIIDFKYSYNSNFYKDKIKKGRDVQLITYAHMLGERQSPVAYYLVPKREMLTNSPAFAVDTIESTSGDEGWTRVRKGVSTALGRIRKGEVAAQGLFSTDELKQREAECEQNGEVYLDPPCGFCDFKALCGLNVEGDSDE